MTLNGDFRIYEEAGKDLTVVKAASGGLGEAIYNIFLECGKLAIRFYRLNSDLAYDGIECD